MKTFLKTITLLGFFTSLFCLTSCGGDDDNDDYASEIVGTYIGQDYAWETPTKSSTKSIGATTIITKVSNKKVHIHYYNEGNTKSGEDAPTDFYSVVISKSSNGEYNLHELRTSGGFDEELSAIIDEDGNINLQITTVGLLMTDFRGTKRALK